MTSRRDAARITVLGAGFGALSTVRERQRRDRHAGITLVAPRAELHYLPGIIWIPSGLRSRADLVAPLDNFLRRMEVDFLLAEVTGLADGSRTVQTTQGDVANDALVIATGGRFLKQLPASNTPSRTAKASPPPSTCSATCRAAPSTPLSRSS